MKINFFQDDLLSIPFSNGLDDPSIHIIFIAGHFGLVRKSPCLRSYSMGSKPEETTRKPILGLSSCFRPTCICTGKIWNFEHNDEDRG